jgi:hypothetical protein
VQSSVSVTNTPKKPLSLAELENSYNPGDIALLFRAETNPNMTTEPQILNRN